MTMRSQPGPTENATFADASDESIGQHIRWQVLLALAGILILATLLGYSAYSVATVLVPGRGGVFREGVAGSPQYINPLRCDVSEIDYDLCTLLYRGLTSVDMHGRIVPDLADSWTVSPDGLVYEFRLKPDQRWDDGRPVTADDVIFTVGIIQNPEVFSLPSLSSLWQSVTAEKVDERTVRFRLKEAFSPFLDYTTIGLLPKHVFETMPAADVVDTLNNTPVGNGPMKVKQLAADHILLEANPYWDGPTPYLDGLELRFYPDHPSLLTAYLAGEIEGISHVLPEMISEVGVRDDLQLFSSTQPSFVNVTLNLNNPNTPFFQDKLVRQALMYGMNREALIQKVTANQGIIAHSPILPENWAYNPNVRHYNYDPITAQSLLDQAGWRDTNGDGVREKDGRPLQFVLHTNDDPTRVAAINQLAKDWEAIGVRAIPTPVTFAGLAIDVLVPRRFEAALLGWETLGDPDPYPLWHSTQAEGAGQNYGGWSNEEADQVMAQARSAPTEEQRRTLYAKFQEIFTEETPALLLYYPVYTYGVADSVHNVQIGAINHPSQRFRGFADWYMVTRRVPASQVPSSAPPTPPGSTPLPTEQAPP
jgi:peptide/nickel transport system substrate-binding protein